MLNPSDPLLSALGPLAPLFSDPQVREIMVDTPERILVERAGQLETAAVRFDSREAIRAVLEAVLALNGESIQQGQTLLQFRLAGSEARGAAVLPPTAPAGPCLVIRKPMDTAWISWEKLLEWGSVTPAVKAFLQSTILAPANILVAGGTASGKTTVANRIAELIPAEKRLVIVEDVHALQIRHPGAVYLEAAAQPAVALNDLIHTASQLRPDWLVFGELSGPAALRALEMLSRGYAGLLILHSNSLEDALQRLEKFCLGANAGLGLLEIRSLVAAAVQCVCYQKLLPDGKRKIVEIAEIRGVENGQHILERIFRYNPASGHAEPTGIDPTWKSIFR